MSSTAAALVCALDLLGKSAGTLPPVQLVALAPAEVSANAEGFVRPGEPIIYVIASSPAYREADCRKPSSLLKLASVIAHENWHIQHGSDERGAYDYQLWTLLRLGAKTDSFVYRGVLKSMQTVLKERQKVTLTARRDTPGAPAAERTP